MASAYGEFLCGLKAFEAEQQRPEPTRSSEEVQIVAGAAGSQALQGEVDSYYCPFDF